MFGQRLLLPVLWRSCGQHLLPNGRIGYERVLVKRDFNCYGGILKNLLGENGDAENEKELQEIRHLVKMDSNQKVGIGNSHGVLKKNIVANIEKVKNEPSAQTAQNADSNAGSNVNGKELNAAGDTNADSKTNSDVKLNAELSPLEIWRRKHAITKGSRVRKIELLDEELEESFIKGGGRGGQKN